jgi:hypothetical protein
MRIKTKLDEIQKDPELMGVGACLLLFLLLVLYKIGTWVGALAYHQLG